MNAQPNHGMQVSTFENPMGIDGFEFVEFASPEPEKLHEYFRLLGFSPVARHRTRKITNYRQGDCTFLINEDPDSFAADFARRTRSERLRFRDPGQQAGRMGACAGVEERR